jgi:hypothetical protein
MAGFQGIDGVPIDLNEIIPMIYQHSFKFENLEEINAYANMVAAEYGKKVGDQIRKGIQVGQTISYIGLSTVKGGGEKRMKQYNHGHIAILKQFAENRDRKFKSVCLWKLVGANKETLAAMELVFGNIANNAGHVLVGTGGGYGLNFALFGGPTYDMVEWHELLIATIGQVAYDARMAKQMAKANAALADFNWDDVEYYYMKNFYTDSALWAGEATAQADLPTAFKGQSQKPPPASGFYGVYAKGKRWAAKIRYDSKNHYLGSFETKQEAALAYDTEARRTGLGKQLNYLTIEAAKEAAVQAMSLHVSQPPPAKRRKTSHKDQAAGWLIEGLAPMGETPWHWVEEESDWVVADYESWARQSETSQ